MEKKKKKKQEKEVMEKYFYENEYLFTGKKINKTHKWVGDVSAAQGY